MWFGAPSWFRQCRKGHQIELSQCGDIVQQEKRDQAGQRAAEGTEPQQVAVEQVSNGLKYSWNWDAQDFEAADDQVMMLAYMPDLNLAVFETAGAKRKAGEDFLPLHPAYFEERMELYASFISKDREKVSNSIYLGRIN